MSQEHALNEARKRWGSLAYVKIQGNIREVGIRCLGWDDCYGYGDSWEAALDLATTNGYR